MKLMVCLVGEQPLVNLLPIRHYKPEEVLFVYTIGTEPVYQRLRKVLDTDIDLIHYKDLLSPYQIHAVYANLKDVLSKLIKESELKPNDVVFNLTGGTKTMAFAAYNLARELSSPFIYLESEFSPSIHHYTFGDNGLPTWYGATGETLSNDLLSIEDYLNVHLDYSDVRGPKIDDNGGKFEFAVGETLKMVLDQVVYRVHTVRSGTLEIDLVMRCGNQIGIAEAKKGKAKKRGLEGIDQLNTAGRREYLGTYTKKFLFTSEEVDDSLKKLARSCDIRIIVLTGYDPDSGKLSQEAQKSLKEKVLKSFEICNY
jgi:hypothetical protein